MIRIARVSEPRRLMHINCLLKMAMQKGILHIKLVNGPLAGDGKTENCTNGGRFDNQTESLITVYPGLLAATIGYKTSLISCKRAVCMKFVAKQPHRPNHIDPGGSRNKNPSAVRLKGTKFLIHGLAPVRILKCLKVGPRDG